MYPLWAASLGKLGMVGVQPMQLLQLSGYLLPWPAEVSGIKGAHRVSGVMCMFQDRDSMKPYVHIGAYYLYDIQLDPGQQVTATPLKSGIAR